MQREICKLCGSEICLNDDASCNPIYGDEKCGSGICNIAGFCGHTKIVECPNGKLNCKDKICLESSTKEFGEAYMCEWECKSGVGEDEICKKNSKDNFIFWSILIVSLLALVSISFFIFRRGLSEKEQRKIAGRIDLLNQEIEKKENELKKIEKSKLNFEEKKKEIQIVKEEIAKETIKLREEKDKLRKERLTPFTNKQRYKVHINEEGYEVLERTGTLFHRWWFEHNKNRKIKSGYEIHHKDFNKRNNEIENLEEITPHEHQEKHYKRYK